MAGRVRRAQNEGYWFGNLPDPPTNYVDGSSRFLVRNDDGNGTVVGWSCPLQCAQCQGVTSRGRQCTRRVCVGLQHCWQHRKKIPREGVDDVVGFEIRASTIQGAGKGVFVHAPNVRGAVFSRGDVVMEYFGEQLDDQEEDRRYGDGRTLGPYVGEGVDAGCVRSIGGMINTVPPRAGRGRRGGGRNVEIISYTDIEGFLTVDATRNIHHGDELLMDYGLDYWEEMQRGGSSHYTGTRKTIPGAPWGRGGVRGTPGPGNREKLLDDQRTIRNRIRRSKDNIRERREREAAAEARRRGGNAQQRQARGDRAARRNRRNGRARR